MSHTPPNELSNNPYQAYPNPSSGAGSSSTYNQSGSYASQSGYPGQALNPATSGVARSDQSYNSAGPSAAGAGSPNLSPHFNGTSAMLMLLSLVSLYEATHRVILYSNSYLPWDSTDGFFPAAALLVGGIWQAVYSLAGLFIALWAVLFDWHSVALTTLALGAQFVGWYTVVVFALAQPALTADKYDVNANLNAATTAQAQPIYEFGYASGALTYHESMAAYVFGWLLPLFALDTALLAGIIFFTIQLMQIQMNNVNELHSPHYYGRRLSFWSLLQLLYGVSTIIYAAIFLSHNINEFPQAEFFYPNLTTWSSLTLITGIMMTIVGLLGLFSCCANNLRASNAYIGMGWITFLWVVAAHVMAQCGWLPNSFNQAGFGMAEMGLFFGSLMIGMYLAYKAATIETLHRGNYVSGGQRGRVVV